MGYTSCFEDNERRRDDAEFLNRKRDPELAALLVAPVHQEVARPTVEPQFERHAEPKTPSKIWMRARVLDMSDPCDRQRRATAIIMAMHRRMNAARKAKRIIVIPE